MVYIASFNGIVRSRRITIICAYIYKVLLFELFIYYISSISHRCYLSYINECYDNIACPAGRLTVYIVVSLYITCCITKYITKVCISIAILKILDKTFEKKSYWGTRTVYLSINFSIEPILMSTECYIYV